MLEKLPFFEDFIKSSNEEIKIKYDGDIDSNIVKYFIDSLYGIPFTNTNINNVDLYKTFKVADFFCVNLPKIIKKQNINKLLEYVTKKNEPDIFRKFAKYFNMKFEIADFKKNYEFVVNAKDSFELLDIDYLLDHKQYGVILNILKTKTVNVWPDDFLVDRIYWKIDKIITSDEIIEHKQEMLKYILFEENKVIFHFKMNRYDDGIGIARRKYIEKFENNS